MRLLATLLLMLVASSAHAYGLDDYLPFTKTHPDSIYLHAMIVVDDSSYTVDSDVDNNCAAQDERSIFQDFKGNLQRAGIEVHVYTYSQLRRNMRLWHDAGLKRSDCGGGYGIALVPYMQASTTFRGPFAKAFFQACSTSVHIIHYGGIGGSSTGHQWIDNSGDPNLMFGSCNRTTFGTNLVQHVTGAHWDSVLVPAASPQDTFFYSRVFWVGSRKERPVGVSQVVRLFRMMDGATTQTDSIVPTDYDNDHLYIAYRVYYTNPDLAGRAHPYVDFVLGADCNSGWTTNNASVLWALTSRWIRLPAIKQAMILTNYGLFGPNPRWASRPATWRVGNAASWAWPRASYCDSVIRDLRDRYGVKKLVIATQPDSLAWLFENYPEYKIARKWNWVRWAVKWANPGDSLTQARSPLGVSYTPDSTKNGIIIMSRRVANRFDPTNATAALRFGIPQSFAYQDSILRALKLAISKVYCPWDTRLGGASTNWVMPPMGTFDYPGATGTAAAAYVSPAESTFVGFLNAGRNVIVDMSIYDPGSFEAVNIDGIASSWEYPARLTRSNSTYLGRRWSVMPDETYRTRDGRTVYFLTGADNADSSPGTAGDPAAKGPSATVTGTVDNNYQVAALLGMSQVRYGMDSPPLPYGRTALQGTEIMPAWSIGRSRVVCWNMAHIGNVPHGWYGDYYLHLQVRYLKQLKALEDGIAGHKLVEWVYPEEVVGAVP